MALRADFVDRSSPISKLEWFLKEVKRSLPLIYPHHDAFT